MAGEDILVLGIDPGTRVTGYGFVRERSGQASLVDVGTIRPSANGAMAKRLGYIYTQLAKLIASHSPDEAAIEDVFTAKNAASALKLGQARGAAMVACSTANISVAGYEPTVVKKTLVGTGRADKSQVAFMVGQILGKKPNWANDASDALAVAICHLNMRRLARLTKA